MKLLLVYTNHNSSLFYNDDEIDIIYNEKCNNFNDLYYTSNKGYYYYLFLDRDIKFNNNFFIECKNILLKDKPAILEIKKDLKIYHRSIIHYIFPVPKGYIDEYYTFMYIFEKPIEKYINVMNNLDKYVDYKKFYIDKNKILILNKYFNRIINKLNNKKYEVVIKVNSLDINYLNTFDAFQYFNIEHQFFKNKIIKFHKNNREMFGDIGTYHFLHDFRNVNRNAIINHLIYKNNYQTYLEIGVYNCYHFDDVRIEKKIGVDPSPKIDDKIYKKYEDKINIMQSSEYFDLIKERDDINFDIIFIDGCLFEANIMNDIQESLKHLNNNGIIVIHDCNPPTEYLQRDNYDDRYIDRKIIWNNRTYTDRNWNGKVWKALIKLRETRDDLEIHVVDTDWGIGLIRKVDKGTIKLLKSEDINNDIINDKNKMDLYNYNTLILHRKEMLNLITVPEFFELYG